LAVADGVAIETEEGKVKWRSDHEITLPCWSTAVKKIMLVQPSSAPAERVFSLLQNAFNKQQDATLEEMSRSQLC
jgi:squalene cyclase